MGPSPRLEPRLTLRSIEVQYLAPVQVDDLVGSELATDHVTEHSIQVHYRASVSKKTVVVRSRYVCLDPSSARLTTAARRTLRIRKQSIAATDGDPSTSTLR
jgi:acyl-CoA thioesterase FadM